MAIKIKELDESIYLISTTKADKRRLGDFLLRFQEHFESPEFAGKIFTLGQYREWYTKKRGTFSYSEDWVGFNFPSSVLKPFVDGLFDPLTKDETKIVDFFRNKEGDFYVIGANDPSAMDHEICHGMYFVNGEYRDAMLKAMEPFLQRDDVSRFLEEIRKHYAEVNVMDELHAYHAVKNAESLFGVEVINDLRQELLAVRKKFE